MNDVWESSNNFQKRHLINFSSASYINMAREYSKTVLFMARVVTAGFEGNKNIWNGSVEPGRSTRCSLMSLSCGPARGNSR